jgi:hypothetical protein
MPELEPAERAKLSRQSAGYYEARLFAELTPDYFCCPANSKAMMEYLDKHKLEPIYTNFQKAYAALKKQNRILPAAEAVSRMSPEEFQKMAAEVGDPVRNYAGQIVGYDLPYATRAQEGNWSGGQRLGGGVGLKGKEAHEYREWCFKNGWDPDTGEKKNN